VQPHEQPKVNTTLSRMRDDDHQFRFWIDGLRNSDPTFAAASILQAEDWGEWQAAVYLVTGCHKAWAALGSEILADSSIGPVVHELDHGRRGWSSSERLLLRWAAHFWDIDISEVSFPCCFDEYNFRRWVTACHLYKHMAPQRADTNGGVQ
jgi:hypothetical protein